MPVTWSARNSVLHVTLDRPDRRNAINTEMAQQIEQALDVLENDPWLRVAIISGAGGHFCAGTDLRLERSPATARGGEYGIVRRPRNKPLIAAIEGVAFGGGLEIALACDLIVTADSARLALPEAQRGVVPTCGGIFRVLETLPEGVAMGLLLAGDEIDGESAARLGLATRRAEHGDAVAVAQRLALDVCRSSPMSLAALLRALRRIRAVSTAEGWAATEGAIDDISAGPDMDEGITAFFDRRLPRWHPESRPS
ncbi:enoyl-CoA hydratase-related protein [Nocardioides sp. CPCC 206347]|uniref:enoyl-CoA hydratase-related protein n=1 Tax=unclassified Nocardioides TaxID=2615069 RepID=UPI00360A9140